MLRVSNHVKRKHQFFKRFGIVRESLISSVSRKASAHPTSVTLSEVQKVKRSEKENGAKPDLQ